MIVGGWLLRRLDNHTRSNAYPKYRAFQTSYQGSKTQSWAGSFLTISWIVALVVLNGTPIFFPEFSELGELAFLIIGVLSVIGSIIISPAWHYATKGPFIFDLSWYPITTRRPPLRNSHRDQLLLDSKKPEKIVVYSTVLGKVESYDFKLVTTHEEINFEATLDLPLSQKPYVDNSGVYCEEGVEDDFVLNIFEVQKEELFRGDRAHYLKIIEVSDIDQYDRRKDIPDEVAEEEGDTVLTIEVIE